ncbi:MAG: hypothetical protein N4J56_007123 [Chroococcidiopsis sp. SAG 2025]|uniref:hypothetical protein n=1 Tax=Chroococcidiopsis sp. SAG 2025 TaxID=171389 RepID=UPI002936E9B5|nr:hypothetical protein [Chroococcidiopsis sp. SAG 2025]MDV2997418.1 hypothetical protein [Chroococcidiopsis sp. SAG 2025]
MTIVAYLQECHLGSDESDPTHAILCDIEAQKMYVGDYEVVRRFVKTHRLLQPTRSLTLEEIIQLQTQIKIYPPTQEEFNRKGMMEMCGRIAPNLQAERDRLIQWLDAQVTSTLIEQIEESSPDISHSKFVLTHYLRRNIVIN